ncbi:MAG TPA: hypothetical protein VFC53_13620 [Dehalococcoidia bacterium]|jgi:uncharacterized membrane protein YesL|nr:hypothetical protein [Dehalococcoidia bacterium]
MGRSRQLGTIMMAVAAVQMLIMVIGLLRRSYLVIALPVVTAVGVASALAFWVGWTMANTEPEMAELESAEEIPAIAV